MSKWKQWLIGVLTALIAALGGTTVVHRFAATAPQMLGCQTSTPGIVDCERSGGGIQLYPDAATPLGPYGPSLYPVDNLTAAGLQAYVHLATQFCDAGPANPSGLSVGDAGCDCTVQFYYPGTLRNGTFWRSDSNPTSPIDAGMAQSSLCGFPASAWLQLTDAGTVQVFGECNQLCTADFTLSAHYALPFDGAPLLPLPTITTFGPLVATAAGGTTVRGTGTNLVNGATLHLGSQSTTIACSGSCTSFTATVPAWSSSAGTSTPQVVTITTAAGSSNSAGNFFYYASPGLLLLLAPDDPGIVGTNPVTSVPDESGNGYVVVVSSTNSTPLKIAPAGSGIGPTAAFNFGGGGPYLTAAIGSYAQPVTYETVTQPTAGGGTTYGILDSNNAGSPNQLYVTSATGNLSMFSGTTANTTNLSLFTGQHTIAAVFNGASSKLWLDATSETLSANPGSNTLNNLTIGNTSSHATSTEYLGLMGDVLVYSLDAISSGAYATAQAIQQQRYGTPIPPHIASIYPDFASATGSPTGGITINGTNLPTSTGGYNSVAFGGLPTTCSGTSTSIQCTAPACTGSTVPTCTSAGTGSVVTVTVATIGGTTNSTGSYPSAFWYLPTGMTAAYTSDVWTTQTGTGYLATWPDQSGNGYVLTPQSGIGPNTPTFDTGGGSYGNLPYWSSTGGAATNQGMTYNGSSPTVPTFAGGQFEWVVAAREVGTPQTASMWLTDLTYEHGSLYMQGSGVCDLCIVQYNQTGNANEVTVTENVDFWLDSYFDGASSEQILNGATTASGTNPGTTTTGAAITVGAPYAHNGFNWSGYIYQVFLYPTAVVPLTSTARSNFAAYFAAKGL